MHEGWLVSLDILSPRMGAQPEITDLPLVGVSFEAAGDGTLFIAAARTSSDHITHPISAPTRVYIERAESGADLALEAESSDGTKAILRFKTPARADTVDGMPR
jgi:hypothetical protein